MFQETRDEWTNGSDTYSKPSITGQKLCETLCAISYYLCNSKNMKNNYGGVLLVVLKVTLLHGFFKLYTC